MPTLADPNAIQRGQAYEKWRDGLGNYLSLFTWQLYGTPSFKFPVTYYHAQRAIEEWVSGFGPQAYAYIAYEKGQAGGRTHAHVLLGGLGGEIARTHAGRLWRHGNIKMEAFDPSRGACWYVSKEPEHGEFVGRLQRRTQRPRGRRKPKGEAQ